MALHTHIKIALVHDFLIQDGGAERVLKVLADIFPEAPIYTLLSDGEKAGSAFDAKRIVSSFLEKYPLSLSKYQWYLPFMPSAIESFNLDDFDIVISSASAFAKGIVTGPSTFHVCYCHTPTRYLWTDTHSYIKDVRVPRVVKHFLPALLTRLRIWDYQAAQRPDVFIANSKNVQERIKKYYRRDSTIVYPPVNVNDIDLRTKRADYFLAGGRIVAYKRFDIIVEAFNRLKIPVKIFGKGPLRKTLQDRAKSNIQFLGWVSDSDIKELYAHAKGFINPQEEDFGITMVEAMAAGCPVLAYDKGGAREIVQDGVNGALFDEQTWESLADSIVRFGTSKFDSATIKNSVHKFSEQSFRDSILKVIQERSDYQAHRD